VVSGAVCKKVPSVRSTGGSRLEGDGLLSAPTPHLGDGGGGAKKVGPRVCSLERQDKPSEEVHGSLISLSVSGEPYRYLGTP